MLMICKETNRNQKKVFGSHCLLVWGFFFPEVCKPVCHYRFNEYSLLLQILKVLMRRPPLSTCLPLHLGFACFLLHVTVFPARKSWVQLPSIWFLSWQQPLCPQKDFGVFLFLPSSIRHLASWKKLVLASASSSDANLGSLYGGG